jgi:hypothetical protein
MTLRGRLECVGDDPERGGHVGTDRLSERSLGGPARRRGILGELLGHETGGLLKCDECGEIEHWILLFRLLVTVYPVIARH